MQNKYAIIQAASESLRAKIQGRQPITGIVLGSGLGKLADEIKNSVTVAYRDLPGFPVSTAIGHKGNFIVGELGGQCVIAMQGRIHYYEGYGMNEVVLPIRVMILLGIRQLIVSNAAGGTNPDFSVGDLMIIRDHINLLPNPLIGPNMEQFGPRFPDMTRPYDTALIRLAKEAAAQEGIALQEGVYVACSGPSYETQAEYRYFRTIGADAVGMSTTPEVIVARHAGLPVFGLSVITDVAHATEDEDYVTDGETIVKAADAAASKMTTLIKRMLKKL